MQILQAEVGIWGLHGFVALVLVLFCPFGTVSFSMCILCCVEPGS